MVPIARKIADLGWHIQLFSDSDNIVELAGTLKDMPVPVVFDQMGHLPEPAGPDHPGFKVIADRSRLARAYVALAPERLVWGTDWPHSTSGRKKSSDTPMS